MAASAALNARNLSLLFQPQPRPAANVAMGWGSEVMHEICFDAVTFRTPKLDNQPNTVKATYTYRKWLSLVPNLSVCPGSS